MMIYITEETVFSMYASLSNISSLILVVQTNSAIHLFAFLSLCSIDFLRLTSLTSSIHVYKFGQTIVFLVIGYTFETYVYFKDICIGMGIRNRLVKPMTLINSYTSDHEVTAMYHIPPVDPWELLEGELTVLDTIGKGAFGEVCKGTLRVGDSKAKNFIRSAVKGKTPQHEVTVAVKKLRGEAISTD